MMRKIVLNSLSERKVPWKVAMSMIASMKIQNLAGLAICFVLRGRRANETMWKRLQEQYPQTLGDIAMNELMSGSNVDPAKLRIDKSKGPSYAQAKLRTVLPASFINVIERIEALESGDGAVGIPAHDDALQCPSPSSDLPCNVVFHLNDCVSATLVQNMQRGNYKGFCASVNFGYSQYTGDELPSTRDEIEQFISNCHYLTSAPHYFIMISCRSEDREMVYNLLKRSRVAHQVHFVLHVLFMITPVIQTFYQLLFSNYYLSQICI